MRSTPNLAILLHVKCQYFYYVPVHIFVGNPGLCAGFLWTASLLDLVAIIPKRLSSCWTTTYPSSCPTPPRPLLPPSLQSLHKISPTDISQFIRLEQCKRYLRLHLLQREQGLGFLKDYGVSPQAIPPLLTKSGSAFEERIEAAVRNRSTVVNFSTEARSPGKRNSDNDHVIALARGLEPGKQMFIFQVRIVALIEGWRIRGDLIFSAWSAVRTAPWTCSSWT